MAPRTAKAKKAAEVSEALKKGRSKAKNIEELEPEADEQDIDEKVAPVAEKKKRGKKAAGDTNGLEENGKDDSAPLAKKGRKKIIEEPLPEDKQESNDDQSVEDEAPEQEDNVATNGDEIEPETSGKGRKKQGKKEIAEKLKEAKSGRSRKPKKDEEEVEADKDEEKSEDGEKEEEVQKPKPAARGRGRKAQPKLEIEDKEEDIKPEPAARGRKKAQSKATKEKTPESDKEIEEEEEEKEVEEEEKRAQPKKKETKGRKGKKVQAKEDSEEREEEPAEELPAAKKRKVTKKELKGQGDTKDEEVLEDEQPEPKTKGKRGQKKAVEEKKTVEDDLAQEVADPTTKRRRKPVEDKAPADDKKKPAPKNKAVTNFEELDFTNRSKTTDGKDWNFKIASWNVDGIRAWMSKGGLDYLTHEKPDILCLQETKCSTDKLPEELANVPGYHAYWLGSDQDGYAGVGIYTTQLAMNVVYGLQNEELDNEGRIITAEYEQFYLICTYVPNAGRKLVTLPKRLQWNEEFRKYVKELDKKKPVIICGDMNVSHKEIDLANPKTNRKNAGFTDEERAGMSDLLGDGFVDTYRHLYPDKSGAYTFWTYMMNCRAKNVGWRLDYFIVSERLLPTVCDNVIRSDVYGSDHCPISLFLHLKGADKPKE